MSTATQTAEEQKKAEATAKEAQAAATEAVEQISSQAQASLAAEIQKAKVYLAEELQRQQAELANRNKEAGAAMNSQESSETPQKTPEQMSGKFGALAMHDDALKGYLEQYALQFNILNYKAANTCYLDAVSTAKTMGIWEDVKRNICPFPTNDKNIQIIAGNQNQPQTTAPATAPPVSTGNKKDPQAVRFKAAKLAVVAAALLGSGVGLALAAERIFSGFPINTQSSNFDDFDSFNPDDVSVEIY